MPTTCSWIRVALVSMGLLALSSCTYLQQMLAQIKLPTVAVVGVTPQLKNLLTTALHFDLRIDNPNPMGLKVQGITYRLVVEEREVAAGRSTTAVQLKPRGASSTGLDVDVRLDQIMTTLFDLLGRDDLRYRIDLVVPIQTGLGTIDVPLRHQGELPVPKRPPLRLQAVRPTAISLQGLEITFDVEVDNPNPFALPVDEMGMQVAVNSRPVVTIRAPDALVVAPRKTLQIPLVLKLSLLEIGLAAADLIKKPTIRYDAQLRFVSGPLQVPFRKEGNFRLE